MTNLDKFNLISARIFAGCYVDFPIARSFSVADCHIDADEDNLADVFANTVHWLNRYGWIDIKSEVFSPHTVEVQLTEKALVALGWLPEALSHKGEEPLGRRMADAFAQGAAAEAGKLVILALKAGMS